MFSAVPFESQFGLYYIIICFILDRHDVATFDLSLNGRQALQGDPETCVSHFDIVSGDLIRIIITQEGAVQSSSLESQLPDTTSQSTGTPKVSSLECMGSGMDIDEDGENPIRSLETTSSITRTKELGTSTSEDNESHPSTSGIDPRQDEHYCQDTMDTEDDLPRSVKEPMLCRSATDCFIPQRLRVLYLENKPQTLDEAVCIVLHVLMLETGFHTEVYYLNNSIFQ